jgi:hypothetical protein
MIENLLFIGAGASYGSSNNKEIVPPLGEKLFDELKKYCDQTSWNNIPNEYQKIFTNQGFEIGMASIIDKCYELETILLKTNDVESKNEYSKINKGWLNYCMAVYFSQFKPENDNLYRLLAAKIHSKKNSWNGIIATINYDKLLYLSLKDYDIKPQERILFLHGACNIVMKGYQIKQSSSNIVSYNEADSYSFIDSCCDLNIPVLCHYHRNKRPENGVSFIKDQQNKFKNILQKQAKNVVIVGVKFTPQDEHIWGKDALGRTKANIYYFNSEDDNNYLKNNWSYFNKNKHKTINKYFNEGFQEICQLLNL